MPQDDDPKDAEWLKIKAAFLNPPPARSSESFVFKVMEDIRAGKKPFSILEFVRWTVPTFALMAAALILITVVPFEPDRAFAVETTVDAETDWMGLEAL